MDSHSEFTEWNCTHLVNRLMVAKTVKPFVLERREAILEFPEDSPHYGLEVRAKLDVDIATFLQFQKLGDNPASDDTRFLMEKFGSDIILEWNMHDEDAQPVSPTSDGFMTLPLNVCIAIVGAWAESVGTAGEV